MKLDVLQPVTISMNDLTSLSRRERQIMDVVFSRGEATATDVIQDLADAPSRAAVRTFLRILENKGHLKHFKRGREFVYKPTRLREKAGRSVFQQMLRTFFDGTLEKAVASHLADPGNEVSPEELERLSTLIRDNRQKE
jgi:BlaI family penicillinase repressor